MVIHRIATGLLPSLVNVREHGSTTRASTAEDVGDIALHTEQSSARAASYRERLYLSDLWVACIPTGCGLYRILSLHSSTITDAVVKGCPGNFSRLLPVLV